MLVLGVLLGVAGASFAVALPMASRWYPPEHQGLALGIAGAGNSGTALAALFAPSLAQSFGWNNVIGLAAIPLAVAFVIFLVFAKDPPNRPAPKPLSGYFDVLKTRDAWMLMLLYSVTFGGFVGLSSSLTIYFNAEYGLTPVIAGFFTAACVFAGSFSRPVGGWFADRFGGVRTLSTVYLLAIAGLTLASFAWPSAWIALAIILFSMIALGAGNGAIFQIAPAALPRRDRRGDRPCRHDRRDWRLLPRLHPWPLEADDRDIPARLPRLRMPRTSLRCWR